MKVLVERVIELKAPRQALWPCVADTDRLNRALGLGALELSPNDDASAARYLVQTKAGGFDLEYEERPFEWVQNERFSVQRIVKKGLIKSLCHDFVLARRDDGGTSLSVRVTAEPRIGLLAPVLRLEVSRFLTRLERELVALDKELQGGGVSRLGCPRSVPPNADVLGRAGERLLTAVAADRTDLAERLIELVRDGADVDVARIRPLELAHEWSVDGRALLGVCLSGVGAGLFDLGWDLICPSCRVPSERTTRLDALPATGHCQLCDLSFDLELDRAVEATFRPTAAVRSIEDRPYCIGGPMRTPHVISQSILPSRGAVELTAPDQPGRYRVFVRGGGLASVDVEPDAQCSSLTLRHSPQGLLPKHASVAPGALLQIEQDDPGERHVKLEHLLWASRAATAHLVSTLPEFRRQFTGELLRPGVSLRVARVAILFTDLTDSTALYTRLGDARAYRLVHDHFELLEPVIAGHRGTIVKTIGDAIMAAFVDEGDAVRAALSLHAAMPAFRGQNADASRTQLKIGVHSGACYVVTANGILDYFGQTVNVAARLQAAAGGGELVLDDELCVCAVEQGWFGEPRAQPSRFAANLKGLSAPMQAARIAVDVLDA